MGHLLHHGRAPKALIDGLGLGETHPPPTSGSVKVTAGDGLFTHLGVRQATVAFFF